MTDKLLIKKDPTPWTKLVINNHYVQIFTLRDVALREWGATFFELNRAPTSEELLTSREEIEAEGQRAVFLKVTHYDQDSVIWFDYASETNTTITFNGDSVVHVVRPHNLN